MGRRVLVVLLSLGAILGFAGGFARLHYLHHHGFGPEMGWGRYGYEDHVADVCARAAERVLHEHHEAPRPPEPPPAGP